MVARVVSVKDRDGRPVLGATVRLMAGNVVKAEAKTHADGRAFLFPPPLDNDTQRQLDPVTPRIVVEHGDTRAEPPPSWATDLERHARRGACQ